MSGLNKIMLIGHAGRDVEIRYTQGGAAVASLSLGVNTVSGSGSERREYSEWYNVVIWGRQAEVAAKYIKKGRQVYVEGRGQTHTWNDQKTGAKCYKFEVHALQFQLLGQRPEEDRPAEPRSDFDDFDIGDLGPPLDMADAPLSPGY